MRWLVWMLAAVAGCGDTTPTAVCDARVWRGEFRIGYADPLDLLFVIDDAPSMAQEREHFLDVQLPPAVDLLLGGSTADGSSLGLPADLHVGVISADLGVGPDARVQGCSVAGDDGQLRNASACGASPPRFVWHFPRRDNPETTTAAVRCMADVGASGCQFSQPLEAAFKALWPAASAHPATQITPPADSFLFRAGSSGHGLDTNAGFLRSDGALSMIAVIILTDQDDCSTHDPAQFSLEGCIRNPQTLRALQTYVNGLRSLRPDNEQLVEVGIIAGVPPQLIAPMLVNETSFVPRNYDALLAAPSMQPQFGGPDGTTLQPSCSSATASAIPPQRLMQFARDFGPSAFVRSICDYDLSALLLAMVSTSAHFAPFDTLCANVPYTPDSRGLLPCRITWELPELADPRLPLTPTSCEERPDFLAVPAAGFPQRSERGRPLCEVHQTPATRSADGTASPTGEGFYFNPAQRRLGCSRTQTPLSFSPRAVPPSGITVHIECVDETQHARAAGSSPTIGDGCLPNDALTTGSDSECGNPMGDRSPGKLFCHPVNNHCVMACDDDAQCPSGWTCGRSGELSARVCVRASCER